VPNQSILDYLNIKKAFRKIGILVLAHNERSVWIQLVQKKEIPLLLLQQGEFYFETVRENW
jgi:hypothetical protein